MAEKLYIDFETRSTVDLKTAGVHKYAAHITTDVLCTGWAFDDEPPQLSLRNSLDERVKAHVVAGKPVIAHNAAFELAIWNIVGARYDWPRLRVSQIDCTMVRAYSMGLPGALARCAPAMGLKVEKDAKGHRLMLKLCKPKKNYGNGRIDWQKDEQEFEELGRYCMQDVIVEREIDKRLLALSPKEKELWNLDQKINWRGIYVDIDTIHKAQAMVEKERLFLDRELRRVTDNKVATASANQQLKEWLISRGIPTDGVAKNAVINLLERVDLPSDVRRALEIRQESAKSSTSKLVAMVNGASADRRVKGLFQFYGAGTGRWAARRIQPHNLPRPTIAQNHIDTILLRIRDDDQAHRYIRMFYGSLIGVISNCLRGFITAAPGNDLIAMDLMAIESRILAWLAGEEAKLQIYRGDGKVYEYEASGIYGIPKEQITKDQRQVGKVCDLAFGFQGGVGAVQAMAAAYRIKLAPAFAFLWANAPEDRKQWALKRWESEKEDIRIIESGISKEEWLASELTKMAWRANNPNIVKYWADIEAAAKTAIRTPNSACVVGPPGRQVTFKKKGNFLYCKLPSGRLLCYPFPKLSQKVMKWGEVKEVITVMGEDNTGAWVKQFIYGGFIVENIVQAVARDFLADAMIRCENRGYPVVLHVHDEIVSEISKSFGSLKEMQDIVSEVPSWAEGLPMAAEGWRGERYRK